MTTDKRDPVMEDIDKLLSKVQKTQHLPTKTLEKMVDRDLRGNRSGGIEENRSGSKVGSGGGLKNKLEEYKKIIKEMDGEDEYQEKKESFREK